MRTHTSDSPGVRHCTQAATRSSEQVAAQCGCLLPASRAAPFPGAPGVSEARHLPGTCLKQHPGNTDCPGFCQPASSGLRARPFNKRLPSAVPCQAFCWTLGPSPAADSALVFVFWERHG